MSKEVVKPFFPLGIVAFPGELVNLHIFEPRYKQLFTELQAGDDEFAILPFISEKVPEVGTLMKLEEIVKTYPSGEMDVRVRGISPVRITSFENRLNNHLYAGGTCEPVFFEVENKTPHLGIELIDYCKDFLQKLGASYTLPHHDLDGLSFELGHRVGLTLEQEYHLLQLVTEEDRQEYLIRAIQKSIEIASRALEMKKLVEMNGHFRYLKGKL